MLSAYFLVQWLEKEELIISPRQAPQILADRVMKEYQQGTIADYAKKLGDHGLAYLRTFSDNGLHNCEH